jgi:hypothetical protein
LEVLNNGALLVHDGGKTLGQNLCKRSLFFLQRTFQALPECTISVS